jgi:hypothetical protein
MKLLSPSSKGPTQVYIQYPQKNIFNYQTLPLKTNYQEQPKQAIITKIAEPFLISSTIKTYPINSTIIGQK